MIHTVSVCCITLYVIVTVVLLAQLWMPARSRSTVSVRSPGRFATIGLATIGFMAAFAFHTLTLVLILRDPRMIALENGADYFLWVSWAISLVYLVFRRWFDFPLLGVFISPAVILFMGSSSYLLHQGASSLIEDKTMRQGILVSFMHAVPALIALVSLVLALVVSIVFLIVERRLKRRSALRLESGGLSLQLLDKLNSHLTKVGFVAISLVIVSGGLWAVLSQKAIFTLDTSVLSGVIVWVFLAAILFARMVLHWSPKKISRLTVVVAGSFLLSVFVVLLLAGRMTHANFWS